jgi:hypothetical protein
VVLWPHYAPQREFKVPPVVATWAPIYGSLLAAGWIVAAMTEGSWYWWAGAIAAATFAAINLSVDLRSQRVRRKPPDPVGGRSASSQPPWRACWPAWHGGRMLLSIVVNWPVSSPSSQAALTAWSRSDLGRASLDDLAGRQAS